MQSLKMSLGKFKVKLGKRQIAAAVPRDHSLIPQIQGRCLFKTSAAFSDNHQISAVITCPAQLQADV